MEYSTQIAEFKTDEFKNAAAKFRLPTVPSAVYSVTMKRRPKPPHTLYTSYIFQENPEAPIFMANTAMKVFKMIARTLGNNIIFLKPQVNNARAAAAADAKDDDREANREEAKRPTRADASHPVASAEDAPDRDVPRSMTTVMAAALRAHAASAEALATLMEMHAGGPARPRPTQG
jgi:hypothetical protein